ncbi:MAG: tannase/feruloyl esterase family alpha/beta hydrolase [Candidatus Solibacter sp.]
MKTTILLLLALSSAAAAQSPAACAEMAKLKLPGVPLEIARAEWIPAGPLAGGRGVVVVLPAHCRIEGMLDRRSGANGKSYGIGFALGLPGNWTGQFLQQGGGGLNGSVAVPLGAQAAGDQPALARGMAVVTTDTGHKGTGGFDSSFMQDQQAVLDFEFVAIGRVATLARQIIEAYYGKPPGHSYYVGCSTGGREAMLMTQRYPQYFDGVVAGAPAMRTSLSNLATRAVSVAFNRIARKGDDGRPIPGSAFSDSDRAAVVNKLVAACDTLDGVKDGMIFDPLACKFDPAQMVCNGPKAEGCLSPEQVDAMQKAFAGPKDSKGAQVYPGFFFDTGITAAGAGGGIAGLLVSSASPVGGPIPSVEQNVDAEVATARANLAAQLGDSAYWVNLNTFSAHGGKLLFYHGVSDPWFSAKDTIGYYERMAQANGGQQQVRNWSRLFLAPGMGHCGGGAAALDSFDMLGAMVNWVEKNTPPDSVTATGRALPGRSRPLCAYPAHAQYKGEGNSDDAANFVCKP